MEMNSSFFKTKGWSKYEGHLKSSWTGHSVLLLCRWKPLCQVVVVG